MSKNTKPMSSIAFGLALVFAALFDILSFIPGVGTLFILFARGTFWMEGYSDKGTTATTLVNLGIEAIPAFSLIPSCLAFVIIFYLKNKANVLALKAEGVAKPKTA